MQESIEVLKRGPKGRQHGGGAQLVADRRSAFMMNCVEYHCISFHAGLAIIKVQREDDAQRLEQELKDRCIDGRTMVLSRTGFVGEHDG
jgi:hypothetical protein